MALPLEHSAEVIYIYIIFNEQRKGRKVNQNALFYQLVSPGGFLNVSP